MTNRPVFTGADLLAVVSSCVTKQLNTLGRRHRLPPVLWSLAVEPDGTGDAVLTIDGHAGGGEYDDTEVSGVVDAWGSAIGLAHRDRRFGWIYEATGPIRPASGLSRTQVRIWGVIDHAAMEADLPAPTRRALPDTDNEVTR